jgi:hypothetical protein
MFGRNGAISAQESRGIASALVSESNEALLAGVYATKARNLVIECHCIERCDG